MTGEAVRLGSLGATQMPNSLCMTTGQVCPGKVALISAFTEPVPLALEADMPVECLPRQDGPKLVLRLAEYDLTAFRVKCAGPTNNVCPSREAMNQSTARRGLVKTVRALLRKES